MKNKLRHKDKVNLIVSVILFLSWIAVSSFLASLNKDTISTYHFTWNFIIGTVLAVIFVFFIFCPNIKFFSKNINVRTKDIIINRRRDYCGDSLIITLVCFMLMGIVLIFGLSDKKIYPELAKAGILEIVSAVYMLSMSIETINYFIVTKEIIRLDYLQNLNEDITI